MSSNTTRKYETTYSRLQKKKQTSETGFRTYQKKKISDSASSWDALCAPSTAHTVDLNESTFESARDRRLSLFHSPAFKGPSKLKENNICGTPLSDSSRVIDEDEDEDEYIPEYDDDASTASRNSVSDQKHNRRPSGKENRARGTRKGASFKTGPTKASVRQAPHEDIEYLHETIRDGAAFGFGYGNMINLPSSWRLGRRTRVSTWLEELGFERRLVGNIVGYRMNTSSLTKLRRELALAIVANATPSKAKVEHKKAQRRLLHGDSNVLGPIVENDGYESPGEEVSRTRGTEKKTQLHIRPPIDDLTDKFGNIQLKTTLKQLEEVPEEELEDSSIAFESDTVSNLVRERERRNSFDYSDDEDVFDSVTLLGTPNERSTNTPQMKGLSANSPHFGGALSPVVDEDLPEVPDNGPSLVKRQQAGRRRSSRARQSLSLREALSPPGAEEELDFSFHRKSSQPSSSEEAQGGRERQKISEDQQIPGDQQGSGKQSSEPKQRSQQSRGEQGIQEGQLGSYVDKLDLGISRQKRRLRDRNRRMSLFQMAPPAALHEGRRSISGFSRRMSLAAAAQKPLPLKQTQKAAVVVEEKKTSFPACGVATLLGYLTEFELKTVAMPVSSGWAKEATRLTAWMAADFEKYVKNTPSVIFAPFLTSSNVKCCIEAKPNEVGPSLPPPSLMGDSSPMEPSKRFTNLMHGQDVAISAMDIAAISSTGNQDVVRQEIHNSLLVAHLGNCNICPNFVQIFDVFKFAYAPPKETLWAKDVTCGAAKARKAKKPPPKRDHQYIVMELCDGGDVEEYIRKAPGGLLQVDELVLPLLFQMSYSLYVGQREFSLRHYDIKLLNFLLKSWGSVSLSAEDDKENQEENASVDGETCPIVIDYGLEDAVYRVRMPPDAPYMTKLADFGTADSELATFDNSIEIQHFTTLENLPFEYFYLGGDCSQNFAADAFALGLCMLHLFTGSAPYEEILEEVSCPSALLKGLKTIWQGKKIEGRYELIAAVASDDEEDILYHTLYRFLVLLGIPSTEDEFPDLKKNKVHKTVTKHLFGRGQAAKQYEEDRQKFSLTDGSNTYIRRARERLMEVPGGMNTLLGLLSFHPQQRPSLIDVLRSELFSHLRRTGLESHVSTLTLQDSCEGKTSIIDGERVLYFPYLKYLTR